MRSRKKEYDMLRAFGLALMVLQHQGWGGILGPYTTSYIMSFHMPLFFIISGMLYSNHSIKETITLRLKSLLTPYFIWAGIYCALDAVFPELNNIESNILTDLKIILFFPTMDYIPINPSIWFLYCMFIVELLFAIITSLRLSLKMKFLILMGTGILGMTLANKTDMVLPFALGSAFAGLTFKTIGYIISKQGMVTKIDKLIYPIAFLFLGIVLAAMNAVWHRSWCDMRQAQFCNIVLYLSSAVLSTNGWLIVFKILKEKMKDLFVAYWCTIGECGVVAVCINEFLLRTTNIMVRRIGVDPGLSPYKVLQFIFVFTVCVLLKKFKESYNVKYIFGE